MRLSSLLLSSTLLASPAFADITADDVWANTQAFYQATGGIMDATLTREGNTVFVDGISLIYPLPYDLGQVVFAPSPMTMVEEPDGSVTQTLAELFVIEGRIDSEDALLDGFELTLVVSQEDFVATVTGTPEDMTYDRSTAAYIATLRVQSEDMGLDMTFEVTGDGYEQTTRIEEGDLIKITTDNEMGAMLYSYATEEDFGYSDEGNGEYGVGSGRWEAALPKDGFGIMNMSAALEQGMFMRATGIQSGSRDEATAYFDGEVFTYDNTSAGETTTSFAFSEDGFEADFTVSDLSVAYEDYSFGELLIDVTVDQMSGKFLMPLLPSDNAQTFTLQTNMAGLVLSDSVWDQFDPAAAISRAPGNLSFDLTGDVILGVDLLDFEALEYIFFDVEDPVSPVSLTLNTFSLDAAGVTADGSGAFTFDNTDTTTFDGLPRPQGEAEITVTGTNALLDTLIDLGVLDPGEASMARMSLGMFTRPAGENTLTATMAVTEDGHMMVNGERLR